MQQVESEREILKAFRPRDRRVVELPKDLKFPYILRDYLAWTDPYGVRTFLVFAPLGGGPLTGIAFRRDQQVGKGVAAHVCEWCHASSASGQIGLLTADASSKRRVGVSVCLDLRCLQKAEDAADLSGQSPRELAKRVVERMTRFAQEGLGLDTEPDA